MQGAHKQECTAPTTFHCTFYICDDTSTVVIVSINCELYINFSANNGRCQCRFSAYIECKSRMLKRLQLSPDSYR